MRTALLATLALVFSACNSPTTGHGGGGGNSGNGGGGGGGGGSGTGGNQPPATHDIVDPTLPPGVVGGFDGTPAGTSGVTLVYPNSGAIVPHDLAPVDVQWNAASPVYRVTFSVDNGNKLRGYVKTADWVPPAGEWQWLLDVAAGHTITLSVDGATVDGSGVPQGPVVGSGGQPLKVSRDDATGALFYFATTGDQLTGDGTLERLQLGSQKADKYLNKTNNGGRCVGCHALSRDGKRVAFTFLDLGGVATGATMSLGDVDATNPTTQQAPANTQAATTSFSPDGSRIITSYEGKLTLREGTTGNKIADVATSGPALFPDWSPDGSSIVFVKPTAMCAPSGLNFGQASIFAYGGSLVTMTASGAGFGNEKVLMQAAAGENNFYPSYSPDGQYVVFARASASSKSSWAMANSSCNGQDGSGLSYDNPSATIWILPAAGGTPVQLTAANGEAMRTNSWPKWGPKADGDYLWLSFSSTRPYGNVLTGAMAHHQIWITAIPRAGATGDPSSPGVWFPFQDTATKNHIGVWSIKVGGYTIP
ncbi:MAG: tolB protein precursor [Myxococcales bacterium]|nr:tolB protein precursor [Myxococcales bacterium]